MVICGIFKHNFLQETNKSITFDFWSLTKIAETKLLLSKQSTTESLSTIGGQLIIVRYILTRT